MDPVKFPSPANPPQEGFPFAREYQDPLLELLSPIQEIFSSVPHPLEPAYETFIPTFLSHIFDYIFAFISSDPEEEAAIYIFIFQLIFTNEAQYTKTLDPAIYSLIQSVTLRHLNPLLKKIVSYQKNPNSAELRAYLSEQLRLNEIKLSPPIRQLIEKQLEIYCKKHCELLNKMNAEARAQTPTRPPAPHPNRQKAPTRQALLPPPPEQQVAIRQATPQPLPSPPHSSQEVAIRAAPPPPLPYAPSIYTAVNPLDCYRELFDVPDRIQEFFSSVPDINDPHYEPFIKIFLDKTPTYIEDFVSSDPQEHTALYIFMIQLIFLHQARMRETLQPYQYEALQSRTLLFLDPLLKKMVSINAPQFLSVFLDNLKPLEIGLSDRMITLLYNTMRSHHSTLYQNTPPPHILPPTSPQMLPSPAPPNHQVAIREAPPPPLPYAPPIPNAVNPLDCYGELSDLPDLIQEFFSTVPDVNDAHYETFIKSFLDKIPAYIQDFVSFDPQEQTALYIFMIQLIFLHQARMRDTLHPHQYETLQNRTLLSLDPLLKKMVLINVPQFLSVFLTNLKPLEIGLSDRMITLLYNTMSAHHSTIYPNSPPPHVLPPTLPQIPPSPRPAPPPPQVSQTPSTPRPQPQPKALPSPPPRSTPPPKQPKPKKAHPQPKQKAPTPPQAVSPPRPQVYQATNKLSSASASSAREETPKTLSISHVQLPESFKTYVHRSFKEKVLEASFKQRVLYPPDYASACEHWIRDMDDAIFIGLSLDDVDCAIRGKIRCTAWMFVIHIAFSVLDAWHRANLLKYNDYQVLRQMTLSQIDHILGLLATHIKETSHSSYFQKEFTKSNLPMQDIEDLLDHIESYWGTDFQRD